ncbi:hypothetical protein SORBI_3008G028533 [Sorghum bicolor]|uniref:Uncharacterized protein n=1 Tax=Sorghum bicolor TaxID=4558 RepID=A0A1Z5R4H4_SORBI|nr:hypothetical protein SORBI_3008G028533 [Sorghum bicolor]
MFSSSARSSSLLLCVCQEQLASRLQVWSPPHA